MKKIISLILFLVPLIFITGCNFNYVALEEKEYIEEKEISNISIEDSNMKIKVVEKDDIDNIKITYYEAKNFFYQIYYSSGSDTLYVKRNDTLRIFGSLSDLIDNKETVLYLPSSYVGSVEIETSNGRIDVKGINVKNLSLETSNGRINVEDSIINNDLSVETSNGAITLTDVESKNIVEAESSNGRIEFENVSGKSIDIDGSNGEISLMDTSSLTSIIIENSNGDLSLNNVSFETSMSLETTTGEVDLVLAGSRSEYNIECRTTVGSSPKDLPREGSKKVSIKTTVGSISISYK